jgi:acetolactate synthase-1/2/3 large subunit
MRVMDVIADYLKKEGVDTLFAYPTTPIIEAAAAAGIRPVLCRQERVGVDMAHGFARVNNGKRFGVFAMQYGPGAENAFSGVATAFSDSAPVLLLPLGQARDLAQTFPIFRSSRSYAAITKTVEEVTLPSEIPHILRRAMSALRNGRLGPVMIEVPADVVAAEAGEAAVAHRPVRAARSAGDVRDVEDAARLLLEARCPVVQAGQGVLYAEASAELVELAELLELPVMTTFEGKSAFPEDHALSLGTCGVVQTGHGRHFLAHADLIIAIGSSLTRHSLVNPVHPYTKKYVQVTNDPRDLYKGYEMDVGIVGDARLVLRQLIDALRDLRPALRTKSGRGGSVIAEIARVRDDWLQPWKAKLTSNEVPITPYRVIGEFMKVILPAEAIVTHDSGSPRDQIVPFYQATKPNSYIGWGKSHALGTGLGLAIGAKVAKPDKFCVNFMGDAAFGMTGLDFETAVRCGIPILTVVLNNSMMAIEIDHLKVSNERYSTLKIGGNYANIARELGGWSERIEHPAQIGEAILRARRQTEEGRTALLEFVTGPEQAFSYRRSAARKE